MKMLCTLFGRAKYSLKGLRYWMVKPKSSFFLFFLEGRAGILEHMMMKTLDDDDVYGEEDWSNK